MTTLASARTPAPKQEPVPQPSQTAPAQPATLSQAMPSHLAGVDADKVVRWALKDAILAALEKNPDIEIARQNVRLSQFDILAAQGVYDPVTSSTLNYNSQKTPTPAVIAADGECDRSAAAIYQTASPAVIFISATSINPYRVAGRVEHIVGSGFIIDGEGLALTNSHVVFGRQSLTVRLWDGTTLPARLLGADPILDIAVLQIPKPEDGKLPVLALGDSDRVRVGEDVLALGNPLGLDQSLTRGIVSAVNRVLPATFFSLQEPLIQVDTPINHGNSGGPLLNRCGEVIGITTAIISDAQNIGLVIPINLAKATLPGLLKDGRLARPWLGFHGQFIDNDLKRLLRLPLRTGFLIEAVEPGSPAEQAQLQGGDMELTIAGDDFLLGGDIITRMNGKRLDSPESVISALQELKVGSELSLTIFRDGETKEVKYKLPERPLLPGDIPVQAG